MVLSKENSCISQHPKALEMKSLFRIQISELDF